MVGLLPSPACCSLGSISALCRQGWHSLPSAACLWLCWSTLTLAGLRLGSSFSPANLDSIPFLFACRLLRKMWAVIRLSPGQADLPCSSLLKVSYHSPIGDLLLGQFLIPLRCALLVLCSTTFLHQSDMQNWANCISNPMASILSPLWSDL